MSQSDPKVAQTPKPNAQDRFASWCGECAAKLMLAFVVLLLLWLNLALGRACLGLLAGQ